MSDQIKIHLVSVLDEAGFTATNKKTKETAKSVREEIDRILKKRADAEKSIEGMAKKTVAEMDRAKEKADALRKKLEELPGPLGKFASEIMKAHKGFASFVGKSMLYIAAFKTGWDIGSWINDNVITPLFKIKDAEEELKKSNKRRAKSAEDAAYKWTKAQDEFIRGLEKEAKALDENISRIDKKTQAYIRMQDALKAVLDAQGDSALLDLQRAKFEDMLEVRRSPGGSVEAEAQVGKYYDVLIAKEKSVRAVMDIDQKILTVEKEQGAEAQKMSVARRRERIAVEKLEVVEKRLKALDEDDSMTWVMYGKNYDQAKKKLDGMKDKATDNLKKAERERSDAEESARFKAVQREELEIKRSNEKKKGEIEVDEKMKAYDDYLEEVEKKEKEKAKEDEKKRLELVKKEEEKRKEMEKKLLDERIKNLQKEMSERQKAQTEAENRLKNAQSASATAWGWYRDKSKLKSVMEERKADEDAEREFQREFARLKSLRKDWRTANKYGSGGMHSLTLDEEAVRQVALTREEEADAQRAVRETRDAVVWVKEHLEQIEGMKE